MLARVGQTSRGPLLLAQVLPIELPPLWDRREDIPQRDAPSRRRIAVLVLQDTEGLESRSAPDCLLELGPGKKIA